MNILYILLQQKPEVYSFVASNLVAADSHAKATQNSNDKVVFCPWNPGWGNATATHRHLIDTLRSYDVILTPLTSGLSTALGTILVRHFTRPFSP